MANTPVSDHEHREFQREVLRSLRRIERGLGTLDQQEDTLMTDVTQLNEAISRLDTDQVAAVSELQTLSAKIGELTAGSVSQAQIDELTQHATAVATALEAGTTAAGGGTPTPAPEGEGGTPTPSPEGGGGEGGTPTPEGGGEGGTPTP